ncbi:MAG TPA: SRPBCC domain-containing protein [Acidimicrobiales bacterium]|nr:SRPBCC domain-containing protein [Acidimicrobiales bacterium]
MTTPDVPLRLEMRFELAASPAQVWDAIATAEGISSWFLPTELDGREGGAIVTHMGEDASSPGEVTGWDPPRRLVYSEPDWAALSGHEGADVTPLVSEFLVEAQSGGTTVVRVVSSAFGTGAQWEQEFFDGMRAGWEPFFSHLELYLTDFAGQYAAFMEAGLVRETGSSEQLWRAMSSDLGLPDQVGKPVELRGMAGSLRRLQNRHALVRVTDPYPGYAALWCEDWPDGGSFAQVRAYLFHPDAGNYVEREQPGWKAWLGGLEESA